MKRRHLPAHTRIPAGRYVVAFNTQKIPCELWLGEHDSDTRLYGWAGPQTTTGFSKEWETYVHLMPLTDDEAACLLATATLLDLRGNAWLDYAVDFVSTLTNEGSPA